MSNTNTSPSSASPRARTDTFLLAETADPFDVVNRLKQPIIDVGIDLAVGEIVTNAVDRLDMAQAEGSTRAAPFLLEALEQWQEHAVGSDRRIVELWVVRDPSTGRYALTVRTDGSTSAIHDLVSATVGVLPSDGTGGPGSIADPEHWAHLIHGRGPYMSGLGWDTGPLLFQASVLLSQERESLLTHVPTPAHRGHGRMIDLMRQIARADGSLLRPDGATSYDDWDRALTNGEPGLLDDAIRSLQIITVDRLTGRSGIEGDELALAAARRAARGLLNEIAAQHALAGAEREQ